MWPKSSSQFSAGAVDFLTKRSLIRFYYPINLQTPNQSTPAAWHPIDYLKHYAPKSVAIFGSKLASLTADCYENQPISNSRDKYDLVIFSHGILGNRFLYSNICCFLAKRGFIVAAIEHRDRSAMHSFELDENGGRVDVFYRSMPPPKGPTRNHSPEIYDYRNSQLNTRVREFEDAWEDCKLVNETETAAGLTGKILNVDAPYLAGHSFGASTVLKVLEKYSDTVHFRKAIVMDPWLFPMEPTFFPHFRENLHNSSNILTILQSQYWCWPGQIAGSHYGGFQDKCWSFNGTRHQSFSDAPFVFKEMGLFPGWFQRWQKIACPIEAGQKMNEVIAHCLDNDKPDLENYADEILHQGFMDKSCFSRNPTKIKAKISEMYD